MALTINDLSQAMMQVVSKVGAVTNNFTISVVTSILSRLGLGTSSIPSPNTTTPANVPPPVPPGLSGPRPPATLTTVVPPIPPIPPGPPSPPVPPVPPVPPTPPIPPLPTPSSKLTMDLGDDGFPGIDTSEIDDIPDDVLPGTNGGQIPSGATHSTFSWNLLPKMGNKRRDERLWNLGRDALGALALDPQSMANLLSSNGSTADFLKPFIETPGKAFNAVKEAASSQKFGDLLSKPAEYGEEVSKAFPVPIIGDLVEWSLKMTKELMKGIDELRNWNKELHEANMKFAEFSGGMMGVSARQQVRDILLSHERGERRAATAEYQAAGKHMLEQNITPWEDLAANVQNLFSGWVSKVGSDVLAPFRSTVDEWNRAIAQWTGGMSKAPAQDFLEDATKKLNKWKHEGRPERGGRF